MNDSRRPYIDFHRPYVDRVIDITSRGHWQRFYLRRNGRDRFRYYWRGVRVPWLAWAMFS